MSTTLTSMRVESAKLGIQKMFKRGWFDICDVDAAAKCLGVHIPSEVYSVLRASHCVNYGDMSREFKQNLLAICMTLFEQPALEIVSPGCEEFMQQVDERFPLITEGSLYRLIK